MIYWIPDCWSITVWVGYSSSFQLQVCARSCTAINYAIVCRNNIIKHCWKSIEEEEEEQNRTEQGAGLQNLNWSILSLNDYQGDLLRLGNDWGRGKWNQLSFVESIYGDLDNWLVFPASAALNGGIKCSEMSAPAQFGWKSIRAHNNEINRPPNFLIDLMLICKPNNIRNSINNARIRYEQLPTAWVSLIVTLPPLGCTNDDNFIRRPSYGFGFRSDWAKRRRGSRRDRIVSSVQSRESRGRVNPKSSWVGLKSLARCIKSGWCYRSSSSPGVYFGLIRN